MQDIYPHQIEVAQKIANNFKNGKLVNLLVAPMQWGKTGTVFHAATIASHDNPLLDRENIWCITGLMDNEWKSQLYRHFPEELHTQILHTGDLTSQVRLNQVPKIRRAIVIIDEAHMASSKDTMLFKWLKMSGCLDLKNLSLNHIRLILTSATPSNLETDLRAWDNDKTAITFVRNNEYYGYKSPFDLNLRQGEKLYDGCIREQNIQILKNTIENYIAQHDTPKYHLIRTTVDILTNRILLLADEIGLPVLRYYGDNIVNLNNPPEENTIVIIKNRLRAAKSISDEWIGVIHTNISNDYTIEAQGLVGRMCGWNKNSDPLIICNVDSITKWIRTMVNGYEYLCNHHSFRTSKITINHDHQITRYIPSFIHPSFVKGVSVKTSMTTMNDEMICTKICDSYEPIDDNDLERFIDKHKLHRYKFVHDNNYKTREDVLSNIPRYLTVKSPIRLYRIENGSSIICYMSEYISTTKKRIDIIQGGRYTTSRRRDLLLFRFAARN
jgi:hypothetical protein